MKRIFTILILLVICLSADFCFAQTSDTSYAGPYYLKQEAYFKALPVKRNAIVF